MKLLLLALAGAFFGQICPVLAQSALPGITQHPQSATVDHGANAYFSVAATGTSLRYQWLLNNEVISDYGNTVGALSPSLRVIGVAQKDAGEYQVVVNNSAGSITSRVATLTVEPTMAFSDDFESGTLGEWTAFSEVKGLLRNKGHTGVLEELSAPSMGGMAPEATKLLITQDRNHSPAGRHSAQLVASRNKMFHNLARIFHRPIGF